MEIDKGDRDAGQEKNEQGKIIMMTMVLYFEQGKIIINRRSDGIFPSKPPAGASHDIAIDVHK